MSHNSQNNYHNNLQLRYNNNNPYFQFNPNIINNTKSKLLQFQWKLSKFKYTTKYECTPVESKHCN